MPGYLRQSTASQSRALGPFLDDTDFKTAETGLTIANTDIKLVVNGGASANKNSGGGTHRVNGVYGVTFDATDTATVGEMEVSVVVAGALPFFDKFSVIEEAVYDALFAASAPGYLQPTTAGRTLDVSAGGEAGIDWANIGSPTTAVNLSATNIDTDQVVASVTATVNANVTQISGDSTAADNLETAFDDTAGSVPWIGIIDQGTSQGGGTASNFIARSGLSLANDIPNGCQIRIVSGTGAGQQRLTTDFVGATDTFTVSPDWTTTPDNTSVYKIDAIAPAVTGGSSPTAAEIADAVWDEPQADHLGAGSFGETATEIAAILVDTGTTLDGRIPAALVGGRMDCSVGANAANVINAASIAADAITEIQAGLSTLSQADVRTAVGLASANLDTQLDALPTNSELATALGTADDATLAAIAAVDAKIDTLDNFVDTEVAAIKAKTDQLTFTTANMVDAAIKRVGDTTITAAGTGGQGYGAA